MEVTVAHSVQGGSNPQFPKVTGESHSSSTSRTSTRTAKEDNLTQQVSNPVIKQSGDRLRSSSENEIRLDNTVAPLRGFKDKAGSGAKKALDKFLNFVGIKKNNPPQASRTPQVNVITDSKPHNTESEKLEKEVENKLLELSDKCPFDNKILRNMFESHAIKSHQIINNDSLPDDVKAKMLAAELANINNSLNSI